MLRSAMTALGVCAAEPCFDEPIEFDDLPTRLDATGSVALARSLRRHRPARRKRRQPPDRLVDDLCRRYAGENARLWLKVDYWLKYWFLGWPIDRIARVARKHTRTIMGHLDDVEAGLRVLYGRQVGNPVEAMLGFAA